jgi:hypothetical protein
LNEGYFSESLVNAYFKILEKMNLTQLCRENHQRNIAFLETPGGRGSMSSNFILGTNTLKIQYLTTHAVRQILMINGPDGEGL